jgi:acyl-CoA-binding protein
MTLLKIYALDKQGSSGDASGERPGFTDMGGRAKFDAWAALKGTSQDEAMQQYVDLIEELKSE